MGEEEAGTNAGEAAGEGCPWNIRDAAWAACFEAGLYALFFNMPRFLGWVGVGYPVALWALSRAFSGPIVAWRASREFKVPVREFGVRRPGGGALWVVIFTSALALVYLGGGALLFYCRRNLALALTPGHAINSMGFAWAAVAYCFSAPVGEEIIYRGILYPALRERFGVPKAILVSAVIFALMHNVLAMRLFPPTTQFIGGLIFAYAYEKSNSLVYPVIYHACGNGLLFLAYALA